MAFGAAKGPIDLRSSANLGSCFRSVVPGQDFEPEKIKVRTYPAREQDGLIWVYGPGDDGVMAFTDFGIETLTGLIEIYKADPGLLKRSSDPK